MITTMRVFFLAFFPCALSWLQRWKHAPASPTVRLTPLLLVRRMNGPSDVTLTGVDSFFILMIRVLWVNCRGSWGP